MTNYLLDTDHPESDKLRRAERKRISEKKLSRSVSRIMDEPIIVGLLRFEDANVVQADMITDDGIVINIPGVSRPRVNDRIRLYTDTSPVEGAEEPASDYAEIYFVKSTDIQTGNQSPISVWLPRRHLSHGRHSLYYSYQRNSTGAFENSNEVLFIIDREPPIPAGPITIPAELKNIIKLEDFEKEEYKNGIPAKIQGYGDIRVGDSVFVIWVGANSTPLHRDVHLVTKQDVDNNEIEVLLTKEYLSAGGEGRGRMYYTLKDRAGNTNQSRSPDSYFDVLLKSAASDLQAPLVPLADDGLINDDDAREPIYVQIPEYTNALAGDSIIVYWGGMPLRAVNVPIDYTPGKDIILEIAVPRAAVWAAGSGDIIVNYSVSRGPITLDSPNLTVKVNLDVPGPIDPDPSTPENEALTPLTVKSNNGGQDNTIGPVDIGKGATVSVPTYNGAVLGDKINIYWGPGNRISTYTLVPDDLNGSKESFDIPISSVIVDATPNTQNFAVFYTLENNNGSTLAPTTFINVRLTGPGGPLGLKAAKFLGLNSFGWLAIAGGGKLPNTTVRIERYINMELGDKITLHWIGNDLPNGDGADIEGSVFVSQEYTVDGDFILNGLDILVPPEPHLTLIEYGSAKVYYIVNQEGFDFVSQQAIAPVDIEPF